MRSIRYILPLALAAVSATALATGITAAAPAANGGGPCTWQPLALQNGWQSGQSPWGTGDPRYCTAGAVTYLAGSLIQPPGGSRNSVFAALPAQAAPASIVYLSIYTYGGTAGVLRIYPNGEMEAYSTSASPGSAAQFTSLAGVSFVNAQSSPQALPLNNGWQSADGKYGTGNPSFIEQATT